MSDDKAVHLKAGRHEVGGHSFVLARDIYVGDFTNPDDFAEIDGKPADVQFGDLMPYWLSDFLCGPTLILSTGGPNDE